MSAELAQVFGRFRGGVRVDRPGPVFFLQGVWIWLSSSLIRVFDAASAAATVSKVSPGVVPGPAGRRRPTSSSRARNSSSRAVSPASAARLAFCCQALAPIASTPASSIAASQYFLPGRHGWRASARKPSTASAATDAVGSHHTAASPQIIERLG